MKGRKHPIGGRFVNARFRIGITLSAKVISHETFPIRGGRHWLQPPFTMNILRPLSLLSLAFIGVCALLASPLAAKPAAAEEPALQAFVSVPPTFRPMLDDDIARALAYRMEETFRRQGYQGTVGFAAHPGDIKASIPVLELTLTEWRLDMTGNVQCTFSAKLTQGKAETNLGLFMGTGIHWTHTRDRWRLAGAYEDSANDAMKDLYRKIATDKLLPGFELKRK